MTIFIIEDELPAYKRLYLLLQKLIPFPVEIGPQLDSISSAVTHLKSAPNPDLIFLDIQLADGLSFSIFEQVEITSPIIFTTAFDQYALKAFQVHSIDYLLKPIETEALQRAIEKFQRFYKSGNHQNQWPQEHLQKMIQDMQQPNFRERFMVKTGSSLGYLKVSEIAYFYSDQSLVFARKPDGKKYHLDTTLDQVMAEVNPAHFFRISRKMLIHLNSINKIDTYFNGRLLLQLTPQPDFPTTVSRDRVNDFKSWLDQ